MKHWITEAANLMKGDFDLVAAKKANIYIKDDIDKDLDECLMGYAIAKRLLDVVFLNYARQKHTLSDEDNEKFKIALQLARKSIPKNNPLLLIFLKEAQFIDDQLNSEIAELEKYVSKSA